MIRKKYLNLVLSTLDGHKRFDSGDFDLKTSRLPYSAVSLKITFSAHTEYSFTLRIPGSTTKNAGAFGDDYVFKGDICPGEVAYKESFEFVGISELNGRLVDWMNYIWEEVTVLPEVKAFENQEQEINEILSKMEEIEDNFFTKEEASDLLERLKKLEKSFKEEIKANEKDKKKAEKKIKDLENDIETLGQTLKLYKKKNWVKGFTRKVYKWTRNSKNRDMLKDGYKLIREFVPEDVKSSLPDID